MIMKQVKKRIKQILQYFNYDLVPYNRYVQKLPVPFIASTCKSPVAGRALVSYLSRPMILVEDDEQYLWHSNFWESREIVRIFNELGFQVDVINHSDSFCPPYHYDVIFDVGTNLQRFLPFLAASTIKIFYATSSYHEFHNAAELQRVNALEVRRSCYYTPKRIGSGDLLVERSYRYTDFCGVCGNDYVVKTYPEKYQHKITPITVSGSYLKQVKIEDEFVPVEREFLWHFGSGCVHKGLDLVLEVFARHPELTLNIVGFIDEPDFQKIYYHELHNLPNIRVHGGLKASSELFGNIVKKCFAFVAPSCSEGISPAVITCMQIGLYPIISRQTGISLPIGYGQFLENCSIDEIEAVVLKAHSLPAQILIDQITQTQAFARKTFSREKFTEEMRSFIQMCLVKGKEKYARTANGTRGS